MLRRLTFVMSCAAACSPGPAPGPVARDAAVARGSAAAPARAPADAVALPAHRRYPTLVDALRAVLPADARVIGFGELHARVDRAPARSALAAFTEALPGLGERFSDLAIETWVVDPKCGRKAAVATAQLETAVKRPEATKSEITILAETARASRIQPHAMTVSCADYDAMVKHGEPDPVAVLGLVTRELTRIATSAVAYRDRQPERRPWIAVYGGALHNDRFPAVGVEEWSYAAAVDRAAGGRYVEIDLIAPELAEGDAASRSQPWFPLVGAARAEGVLVWVRGERSFVVILPRTRA